MAMTRTARRVIWRARCVLVHHYLGRATDEHVLEWARFIVRVNG
jgi:hypothetical protein